MMFDILIKRKKIVLDCFTYLPHVYEYARIDHGAKFLPDWWKKTPSMISNVDLNKGDNHIPKPVTSGFTIKHCKGLKDLYKNSIIIPSWFSLVLKVSSIKEREFNWFSSTNAFKTINHEYDQFSGFCKEDGFNFKIKSPWALKCNKKIPFVWSQPTWSMRDTMFDMIILPGVMNYYEQHATHINFFIRHDENPKVINIEPLQPLVMLHPMIDEKEKIELRYHLLENEEKWRNAAISLCDLFLQNLNQIAFVKGKIDPNDGLKLFRKNKKLRNMILENAKTYKPQDGEN